MNANTYSGHSSGSWRNAFTAMNADITTRIRWVTIVSRRRSRASAKAPPTIGNTKTGISSTSPISPTASVDPVIS